MNTIANVTVGRPQVKPSAPSHVPGVAQGNTGKKQAGLVVLERGRLRGTARRSTGINAHARNPIDPRMPNLSPA